MLASRSRTGEEYDGTDSEEDQAIAQSVAFSPKDDVVMVVRAAETETETEAKRTLMEAASHLKTETFGYEDYGGVEEEEEDDDVGTSDSDDDSERWGVGFPRKTSTTITHKLSIGSALAVSLGPKAHSLTVNLDSDAEEGVALEDAQQQHKPPKAPTFDALARLDDLDACESE